MLVLFTETTQADSRRLFIGQISELLCVEIADLGRQMIDDVHARNHGIYDIYTMNIDGTDWRKLTDRKDNNEDPSWAPDGKHLVFSSNRTGEYQIYIMRDDGTNVQRLTYRGMSQSPAWSPTP